MTTVYLGSGIDLLICDNGAVELKQEKPPATIMLTPDKVCQMMDAIKEAQGGYPTLEHSEDFVYGHEGRRRWATESEQQHNKRCNVNLTYDGITMTTTEWARKVGLTQSHLRNRIRAGWDIERALTTPIRRQT